MRFCIRIESPTKGVFYLHADDLDVATDTARMWRDVVAIPNKFNPVHCKVSIWCGLSELEV